MYHLQADFYRQLRNNTYFGSSFSWKSRWALDSRLSLYEEVEGGFIHYNLVKNLSCKSNTGNHLFVNSRGESMRLKSIQAERSLICSILGGSFIGAYIGGDRKLDCGLRL